jgi:hypothetical protein
VNEFVISLVYAICMKVNVSSVSQNFFLTMQHPAINMWTALTFIRRHSALITSRTGGYPAGVKYAKGMYYT